MVRLKPAVVSFGARMATINELREKKQIHAGGEERERGGCNQRIPAPVEDAVHLPAFFPKFRMSSTFSSILLRTTSKASF